VTKCLVLILAVYVMIAGVYFATKKTTADLRVAVACERIAAALEHG
jgi:hypothetical protein